MHFGIICPPVPGHLYSHCSLARELISRGHRATVFNIPDAKAFVLSLGVEFVTIGNDEYPLQSWHRDWAPGVSGSNPLRDLHILNVHIDMARIMLRDLPDLLKEAAVDALIVDQLEPQGATLAEVVSIPFVTLCSILPIHADRTGSVPSPLAWWVPTQDPLNRAINKMSHAVSGFLAKYFLQAVNTYRKKRLLKPVRKLEDTFSTLAQIGVIPAVFDFSRPTISPCYFSTGPFIKHRDAISFPWDKLDGRPIVYASFGTIRNRLPRLFKLLRDVIEQCPHLQFVVSKGAWIGNGMPLNDVAGSPIIVDYAPQLQILQKACLCITHSGPGTVMEALYYGVPLVAVPIADDQPAMAARIRFHGVGITLSRRTVTTAKLRRAIETILHDKLFTTRAQQMAHELHQLPGVDKGADIVESALAHHVKSNTMP